MEGKDINFIRAYQEMILKLTNNTATFRKDEKEDNLIAHFNYHNIDIYISIPLSATPSLATNMIIVLNYKYRELTDSEQSLLLSTQADTIYFEKIIKPWREHYKYLGLCGSADGSVGVRRRPIHKKQPELWIDKQELISLYSRDNKVDYAIGQLRRYIGETLDEYVVPFEQLVDMTETFLQNVLDIEEI